jgi:5'-3' exoribonuclease 2
VPKTEQDMYDNLRDYINTLVDIVNPRKLIYMAIDGVAPRAKMNQQRGRRFRSAQEIYSTKDKKKKLAKVWENDGFIVPEEVVEATAWDHNVITPGTVFMKKLSMFIKVPPIRLI